jgi:hypothetical protein
MKSRESNERVYVLDEHGDGSVVWHAYWEGGFILRIYKGTVINNTINMQLIVNRSIALNFGLAESGLNAKFKEIAKDIISTYTNEIPDDPNATLNQYSESGEIPPVLENKDMFANRHPNPKFWGREDWVG